VEIDPWLVARVDAHEIDLLSTRAGRGARAAGRGDLPGLVPGLISEIRIVVIVDVEDTARVREIVARVEGGIDEVDVRAPSARLHRVIPDVAEELAVVVVLRSAAGHVAERRRRRG